MNSFCDYCGGMLPTSAVKCQNCGGPVEHIHKAAGTEQTPLFPARSDSLAALFDESKGGSGTLLSLMVAAGATFLSTRR
jgi:hypothetical protein